MAPRSRLLDLETQDVLFFYGDLVGVATHAIVFWPVLLAAALILRLIAPLLPHAAAACAGLYVAYRFLLHRAARSLSSSAGSPAAPSHTRPVVCA
ncbi:uncharacterized protein [Setaria viridis]|uniref:Uncharacterized protein n=1 Tax=Setaria viridis TaxID=4556 RepID=A0A4U6WB44_SETVI|nr:uncharacterized protein LOC117859699 [Setaria viridis]TKW39928.1 hypothetical protein SEVIR_1G212250v2 [Setaria viridis]